MKNVLEFIAWAMAKASSARIPAGSTLAVPLNQVGKDGVWQYLFGTTGTKCTKARLDKAYAKYYKGWGWSRSEYDKLTSSWIDKATVCDCQGLEDCFSKADTNAKGNYANYCTSKGRVIDIHRDYVLGEAVFVGSAPASISHVGWVCGFAPDKEPLILHERGLAHGCVIERMSSCGKKWTYRGIMTKRYEYTKAVVVTPPKVTTPAETKKPAVVLKVTSPMMKSGEVKAIQEVMNALGYDCGKADGVLGNNTAKGIRAFVSAHKDI